MSRKLKVIIVVETFRSDKTYLGGALHRQEAQYFRLPKEKKTGGGAAAGPNKYM